MCLSGIVTILFNSADDNLSLQTEHALLNNKSKPLAVGFPTVLMPEKARLHSTQRGAGPIVYAYYWALPALFLSHLAPRGARKRNTLVVRRKEIFVRADFYR